MSTMTGSEKTPKLKGTKADSNLPFDDRMKFSTSPWVPKLARGSMQGWSAAERKAKGPQFFFLFNPNAITVSYSSSPVEKAAEAQDTTAPAGVGGEGHVGLSFDLLFDRSYEVAYRGDKEGVLRDVKTMETMLAVTQLQPRIGAYEVLQVILGHDFVFYVTIPSLTVVYGHFNHDMIPMRCTMSISAKVFPLTAPQQANLNSAGYGSAPTSRGGKSQGKGKGGRAAHTHPSSAKAVSASPARRSGSFFGSAYWTWGRAGQRRPSSSFRGRSMGSW